MTQKEKAELCDKAYDKVAARFGLNVANEIFTELKESEDERIRKALIQLVNQCGEELLHPENARQMLAWLEKQGEKLPVGFYYVNSEGKKFYSDTFKYGDVTLHVEKQREQHSPIDINKMVDDFSHTEVKGYGIPSMIEVDAYRKGIEDALEKQGEQNVPSREMVLNVWELGNIWKEITKGVCNTEHGTQLEFIIKHWNEGEHYTEWLEKQGEQKPCDKVEPKFKAGDWVTNGLCSFKISSIDDKYYWGNEDTIGEDIESINNQYHLWTIQDAKEGDVLVDVYENIGIYQQHDDFDWTSYCSLGFHGGFQNFKVEHENDKTHPATKEQRDQLEKAMKEEGYEWDAEKKELKKIPNALEECEIEHIEHGKYYYCIKDYYSGGCKRASKGVVVQALRGKSMMALGAEANKYFIPVKYIVNAKPVWSEEDEYLLDETVQHLEELIRIDKAKHCACDVQYYQRDIDWLKSLKDRIGG